MTAPQESPTGRVIPDTSKDTPFVGEHPGCDYDAPHRHAEARPPAAPQDDREAEIDAWARRTTYYDALPVGPSGLSAEDKDDLARMALDEDTAVSLVEWVEQRLARPQAPESPEPQP